MFAVIRIRGRVGVRKELEDTLRMLRLKAPNNCVIVPEAADFKGMLFKVKDLITWGEISKEMLIKMLRKRLRLRGEGRLDEEKLKEATGFGSYERLADALIGEKVRLKNFLRLDPVFRLTPPSKGFKSTKESYPRGDLGYRGEKINELLERMI